ncbi:MAG: molybdopterin-dependent oxidoreductase, partial [Sneathiella sp.]|nr:molybdopterin-dependent oxidoreductase [Sneathiella sp.]
MEHLKATGNTLKATAINDYSVDIPVEDIQKHDVIIAYKMNGKFMSIRDKGPLWVIYPWSDTPSLRSELYHSRSIWQLIEISIE